MSKGVVKSNVAEPTFCQSTFTLTFAVEVLSLDVWEDCNEGWLEQGSCVQGVKLNCQLYYGQNFELDVMIWPHTAKIWCGAEYGWVRVWHLLERRWLAFSISFAFAVRVNEMQSFVATIVPSFGLASLGATAKNDKNSDVLLPPLGFGDRRYFAPVLEHEETLATFVQKLIWQSVKQYIPWSHFDGVFNVPGVVKDSRHQDTCFDNVRDLILKRLDPSEEDLSYEIEEPIRKLTKRESRVPPKEKDIKKKPTEKLEMKLSGERILAGTGRLVPFETVGEQPPDSPEIIVLISSNNLPAQDDLPIVFLNVGNLDQIPLNELKILRVTHLYTKWHLGEEENCSEPQPLKRKTTSINFNSHRALPIPYEMLPKITSEFLDHCFKLELRGIRLPSVSKRALLFGYEKGDRDFGRFIPKTPEEELDFLIAVTHIDAKHLAKGINAFLSGEFPLYPPRVKVKPLEREAFCTNDINHVRMPMATNLIVKPDVILQAQMSLEVSIGVVGCKTRKLSVCFSRIFCVIRDSEAVTVLLRCIQELNQDIMLLEKRDDLLSGFALDTGSTVILYVEGPKDFHILRIWEMTEDFYPKVKPVFSCSDRYSTRIYPEMITTAVPFVVLKMFLPLGAILACPPIYARPALPLPTRSLLYLSVKLKKIPEKHTYCELISIFTKENQRVLFSEDYAVLKIDRLIAFDFRTFPSRCYLPTTAELMSFRLELCVAARPLPVVINDCIAVQEDTVLRPIHQPAQQRINWNK